MRSLRLSLFSLAALALCAMAAQRGNASFVQTQRSQISVYILVNATPAVGFVPAPAAPAPIALRMRLRARGSSDRVDAPGFVLTDDGAAPETIAQVQNALRVQAEVSPNPNATLLYSNNPGDTINGTAGTTVAQTCAYTVTVHTTQTSWTLYEGLSNDFNGAAFPGSDLSNNSYLQTGTPNPAPTAFVVYPDNNNQWGTLAKSGGIRTYCVDLSLAIPITASGAYTTNAVYTLYY